jgi:hypothetical protein
MLLAQARAPLSTCAMWMNLSGRPARRAFHIQPSLSVDHSGDPCDTAAG